MLTNNQIQDLLTTNNITGKPVITLLKRHNHVYRIETDLITAYLKIYTKDWYGDDVNGTGYCVDHEVAAWRKLSAANLAVPRVLLADTSSANPLQRPYLLTQSLAGTPYPQIAQQDFKGITHKLGSYLRAMHNIVFPYPGYITSTTPIAPLADNEWQHFIWTFEQFAREAHPIWSSDRETVDASLMDSVAAFYTHYHAMLKAAYSQPRFTHGDCHASQFFVNRQDDQWLISGVVDMEVASAGDCGADFVKLGIELAAQFPASSHWWEALFEGYGTEPSFELQKLRMLAAHHSSYNWIWKGSRAQILDHILSAQNWQTLYDIRLLGN
jgi:Ser/Thr protein kinase RdoA (MazF antagonist)